MSRVMCIPVDAQGQVDPRWGWALRVALVTVEDQKIAGWNEVDVHWDALHDQSGEGQHHARVAKFLMDNGVTDVVASHMGQGMARMLASMRLEIHLDASGDAREVIERLIRE